ncbi:MAG: DUF3047 domain-containing protein [Burkholderiales bacterium]|nr:DUF3047 domain-containing protein [Burkholderiales bacterium]
MLLGVFAVCLPLITWAEVERIDIARFSQGDLNEWQSKVFSGQTIYTLTENDGKTVLHAHSNATASGLYREISIDLDQTPILNWSWKVDQVLAGNNEQTRAGDDYPARVYVVFSDGLMFWRTRAINYVWSNTQPVNSNWFNAFTSNAGMIAVQSGVDQTGNWITESRNVLTDYRRLFNDEPGRVNAVAIMTDTDNTRSTASAWYGDIWFSAK